MAKRRIEPEDPDDFDAMPVILDVAVRIVAAEREWILETREKDDQTWTRAFSGYEPTSCAVGLGYCGLRVLDDDLAKLASLPKLRPAEAQRRANELRAIRAKGIVSHPEDRG